MRRGFVLCLFLFCLTPLACQKPAAPSEKSARDFMESYYVNADLERALTFADGLAADKVRESLKLRQGQEITDASHHPKISYKASETAQPEVTAEEAHYFFEVKINPEKAEALYKKTRLTIRPKSPSVWKVTQFSDY